MFKKEGVMDRGSSLRDKIYINAVLSTVNLISSNVNLIEVYIDEDKEIIEFHFSLSHINNVELGSNPRYCRWLY